MEADGGCVFGAAAAGHCFTRPRRPAAAWCQGSPAPSSSTCHSLYHHKHGTQQSSVNQDKPISLKHIYKIIQFKKYSWRLHTVTSRRDIFGRFSKESCCLPLVSILNYMENVRTKHIERQQTSGHCAGQARISGHLLWCPWVLLLPALQTGCCGAVVVLLDGRHLATQNLDSSTAAAFRHTTAVQHSEQRCCGSGAVVVRSSVCCPPPPHHHHSISAVGAVAAILSRNHRTTAALLLLLWALIKLFSPRWCSYITSLQISTIYSQL